MNKEKLRNLFEQCTDKQRAARDCGMTYQSIYNLLYKENTSCKVDAIERIAKYFGKKVSSFFDEEETNNAVAMDNSVAAINSEVNVGDNERVKFLERLLEEKERTIQILMQK